MGQGGFATTGRSNQEMAAKGRNGHGSIMVEAQGNYQILLRTTSIQERSHKRLGPGNRGPSKLGGHRQACLKSAQVEG